jgi:acyl-CoA synthetase (AMP-forming)/AMP-acid ligase II
METTIAAAACAPQHRTDTLPAILRTWAQTRGDQTFCTFVERGTQRDITFAEVYERSRAYARFYRTRGVQRGELVIIILKHSDHLFYSCLGAMIAGAIPAFLPYPTAKQRSDVYWTEQNVLFDRIAPRLIVTYGENVELAARLTGLDARAFATTIDCAPDAPLGTPDDDAIDLVQPDDIACLQHSSGTTGTKKGVMLSHRAILAAVRSYSAALGQRRDDRVASWLPLYHDMGFIACFLASIVNGTQLIALDPFEWVARPARLLDAIETNRATLCWLPNFAFTHIVNTAPAKHWDLSWVRAFINCSEPCRSDTMERFVTRFAACGVTRAQMHVCYAMAENVFGVTQTPVDRPARTLRVDRNAFAAGRITGPADEAAALTLVSCGRAIDEVEIVVRADDGDLLADGNIGEIVIRSPFLFDGYYRLPERTHAALAAGWYRTGDLGFMHAGELFVTGRIDDMIITNGRNFYAHEIEAMVSEIPDVLPGRAVAFGATAARTDATSIVVLVECAERAAIREVQSRVRQRSLDRFALSIDAVVAVPRGTLVKSTSGKLCREKNRQLYLAGDLDRREAAS